MADIKMDILECLACLKITYDMISIPIKKHDVIDIVLHLLATHHLGVESHHLRYYIEFWRTYAIHQFNHCMDLVSASLRKHRALVSGGLIINGRVVRPYEDEARPICVCVFYERPSLI